jgi:hypothetical protein
VEIATGTVSVASLEPIGAELGTGGQGTVFALPRLPAQVYKAYASDLLAKLDSAVLTAMVELPAGLSAADRRALLERAAWPTAAAERDGQLCGFVMSLVPPHFHTRLRFPRGYDERLGQVQLLLNEEQYLSDRELTVDDHFRLELLHDIAASLRLFHRLGIVVGDLSPNNLLFSRTTRPRSYFIDCDAMQIHGRTVLPQIETTDWQVPSAAEPLGTPAGDAYKFSLFCVRLFAGDQSTTDPSAVLPAGRQIHDLAVRGLDAEPAARPGLDVWQKALASAAARPPAPARPARTAPHPRVTAPAPSPVPRRLPPAGRRRRIQARRIVKLAVLALVLACAIPRLSAIGDWVRHAAASAVQSSDNRGQAEADAVANLLSAAAPIRTKVKSAVTNLVGCTRLTQAASILSSAAQERARSLSRAKALDMDDIAEGPELKSALVSAFDHSRSADDAYRKWAVNLKSRGCRSSARNGSDRKRGDAESATATAAKKQVADVWSRVGARYGYAGVVYENI